MGELDMAVALEITKLPEAGWWRRESMKDATYWVQATGPDDIFREPSVAYKISGDGASIPVDSFHDITPHRYFLPSGEVEEGRTSSQLRAIPSYSSRWEDTMQMRDALVEQGYSLQFREALEAAGGWIVLDPDEVVSIALRVVRGAEKDSEEAATHDQLRLYSKRLEEMITASAQYLKVEPGALVEAVRFNAQEGIELRRWLRGVQHHLNGILDTTRGDTGDSEHARLLAVDKTTVDILTSITMILEDD